MDMTADSFAPNPETLHILKTCIPPEVRLQIFRMAFETDRPREVINVLHNEGQLHLEYKDQHKTKNVQAFESRKLWLQPHVVGQELALEAAEAFYSSRFMFAVHAEHLLDFLRQCPLSGLQNPGLLIRRLNLFIDEERNFTGDGKSGLQLRLADWQSLAPACQNRRLTRSMHRRTGLVRSCWRAIAVMPRISHLECRVMPTGGKQSARDISSWEIRDMLPALWHFWRKGISVRVYFRTWQKICEATTQAQALQQPIIPDTEDPTTFEVSIDVGGCLPFSDTYMAPPTEKDRLRAQRVLRQGFHSHLPVSFSTSKHDAFVAVREDICTYHRVRLYDALADFARRLFPNADIGLDNSDHCKTGRIPCLVDEGIPKIC